MKLIQHFDDFLRDSVNLNQARIDRMNGHVDAIESFVRGSGYAAKIRSFSAQGSWAHKTIIKPQEGKEFDADLVVFVDPVEGWSAKDYVDNLYALFANSGRYADKAVRNTRCVTLDYAGDFHLDVVPCVVEEHMFADDEYFVCNRKDDVYEPTNPEGYTAWLAEKNGVAGKNMFIKSTRLFKYLRDRKGRFSAKSILLTTLLGDRISAPDAFYRDSNFADIPTSFKTLIGRLDDYLQARPVMPVVKNPVLDSEDFNRHWDQEKYESFRNNINRYRQWVDDAYAEADRDESIRKWRKVFGEEFAKSEVATKASDAGKAALGEGSSIGDIVSAVKAFGGAVLRRLPVSLPHIEAPLWPSSGNEIRVNVRAELYDAKEGHRLRKLTEGDVLEKQRWIRFEACQSSGLPFPKNDFKVSWRVVNTDKEAAAAGQLRGDYYSSEGHGIRWEHTEYHGAHWVEAFVISKRNGTCCGRSDRVFVVIE